MSRGVRRLWRNDRCPMGASRSFSSARLRQRWWKYATERERSGTLPLSFPASAWGWMRFRRSGPAALLCRNWRGKGWWCSPRRQGEALGTEDAEALAREVERHGVRVCALWPGPTASEFQKVAGVLDDLSMGLDPADRVAREGLRALAAGEHSVIS